MNQPSRVRVSMKYVKTNATTSSLTKKASLLLGISCKELGSEIINNGLNEYVSLRKAFVAIPIAPVGTVIPAAN